MLIHRVQGEAGLQKAGNTGTKGRAASEFAVYSVKVKMNTETARVHLPKNNREEGAQGKERRDVICNFKLINF